MHGRKKKKKNRTRKVSNQQQFDAQVNIHMHGLTRIDAKRMQVNRRFYLQSFVPISVTCVGFSLAEPMALELSRQ
jgi:hypothetical protein